MAKVTVEAVEVVPQYRITLTKAQVEELRSIVSHCAYGVADDLRNALDDAGFVYSFDNDELSGGIHNRG